MELCHLAVHQVDETTRSGNNDLTTLLELTDLSFNICTPINGYDVETINVAAVVLQIIRNLQAEFACGAEDDDLGGAVFGVDVLQHGKTISSGLTCASLCQSDDVAVTIALGWGIGVGVSVGSHFCYGFDAFFKAVCGICTFSVERWCCFGVHGGIVGSGFAVVGSRSKRVGERGGVEEDGNYSLLDGSGVFVAHLANRGEEFFSQTEF